MAHVAAVSNLAIPFFASNAVTLPETVSGSPFLSDCLKWRTRTAERKMPARPPGKENRSIFPGGINRLRYFDSAIVIKDLETIFPQGKRGFAKGGCAKFFQCNYL